MFLAVPNLLGIDAFNLDAVPIRPLEAEDRSLEPPSPPRLDNGLLEGGRDISIVEYWIKFRREIVYVKSLETFVYSQHVDMETLIFFTTKMLWQQRAETYNVCGHLYVQHKYLFSIKILTLEILNFNQPAASLSTRSINQTSWSFCSVLLSFNYLRSFFW